MDELKIDMDSMRRFVINLNERLFWLENKVNQMAYELQNIKERLRNDRDGI